LITRVRWNNAKNRSCPLLYWDATLPSGHYRVAIAYDWGVEKEMSQKEREDRKGEHRQVDVDHASDARDAVEQPAGCQRQQHCLAAYSVPGWLARLLAELKSL
jgi:hypothetical protein